MRLRKAIAVQMDRLMRVVPIVNMVLLVTNLSLVVASTMAWRGWGFYATASGTAIGLLVAGVVFANLWTVGMKMIHASRTAAVLHDPMQVYQFTPWERVVWRSAMLPQMRHQARLAEAQGVDSQDLWENIGQLERWESLGYIPRNEYPDDLAHLYLRGGGSA